MTSCLNFHKLPLIKFKCNKSLTAKNKLMATSSGDGKDITTQHKMSSDAIVQYVVLRKDLWKGMGWPMGSVVAQACHASTAVIWISVQDSITQEYCNKLDYMTKVFILKNFKLFKI